MSARRYRSSVGYRVISGNRRCGKGRRSCADWFTALRTWSGLWFATKRRHCSRRGVSSKTIGLVSTFRFGMTSGIWFCVRNRIWRVRGFRSAALSGMTATSISGRFRRLPSCARRVILRSGVGAFANAMRRIPMRKRTSIATMTALPVVRRLASGRFRQKRIGSGLRKPAGFYAKGIR